VNFRRGKFLRIMPTLPPRTSAARSGSITTGRTSSQQAVLARRVVAAAGGQLKPQRVGIMKFGSRMDGSFRPPPLTVAVGARVWVVRP
jgi:hypothetical protein